MSITSTIRSLAERTPADRNRAVDALRAASILVVVIGHWLMAAVVVRNGELIPGHLLDIASWTHPLTWLLQVMPIFFLVGGYSNGISWRSARRRGEPYGVWLRTRLRRLVLPVVPVLLFWVAGGWLALGAGIDWQLLQTASQVALVPTWFLAAYVVVVTVAPLTMRLWEAFGWRSVLAGGMAAAVVDVVSISNGWLLVGFVNYLLVWGTVHQLGYAWLDERIGGTLRRAGMSVLGLSVVAALVTVGPYPVAMVGLDGAEVANSYPPRVTLVALGLFQAGAVLALEAPLRRFLQRRRVWEAVVAVNSHIMSLYLWHLTAMIASLAALLALGGPGLGTEPGSAAWWSTRPVWIAALSLVTLAFLVVFGRFERPAPDPRPAPAAWRPVLAVVGACTGLGLLASTGIADVDGLNGLTALLPLVALLLGGVGELRVRIRG